MDITINLLFIAQTQYNIINITAIQISEKRQKVKTSDESIKMRKFISMTMTMLKIGFIGFGGGSALIPVIEDEVVEKDKIVSEE